jgi:hypothetical protein
MPRPRLGCHIPTYRWYGKRRLKFLHPIWFFRQLRILVLPLSQSWSGLAIVVIGFGVLLAELLVALGFLYSAAPFLYLVALVWFLFLAASQFAVLIFPAAPVDSPDA